MERKLLVALEHTLHAVKPAAKTVLTLKSSFLCITARAQWGIRVISKTLMGQEIIDIILTIRVPVLHRACLDLQTTC